MSRPTEERLTAVESSIMHMQHDIDALSEALIQHGHILDEIKKSIEKLSSTVENLEPDQPRDPMDERPPHY